MSIFRKTYRELIQYETFEDRFEYLRLSGIVCKETFGFDRYLNQQFYSSKEWRDVRDFVIIRDGGCDLAHPDFEIQSQLYVHHINPITKQDILEREPLILDPENLVLVSFETHNAIHYGDKTLLRTNYIDRKPNDTCPWKGGSNGQHTHFY